MYKWLKKSEEYNKTKKKNLKIFKQKKMDKTKEASSFEEKGEKNKPENVFKCKPCDTDRLYDR